MDVEKRHSIPALDRQAAAAILAAMVQMSHQGKLVVAQVVQTRDREELFQGKRTPEPLGTGSISRDGPFISSVFRLTLSICGQ